MDARDHHASTARTLLGALTDDQRTAAALPFDDAERLRWTYLPGERAGVALADLDRRAAAAGLRLLATGLSRTAFAQAATIMALEDVLDAAEGGGLDRHRGDYWVAVFGDPDDEAWSWRVGGHHVSVHVTWTGDDLPRATPMFLGANPARTTAGEHPVVAPLEPEEALGFRLVQALDREALARAVIDERAPDDIVTGDASRVDGQPQPTGVPIARLDGDARRAADELVSRYLGRLPAAAAVPPTDDLTFAWAGERRPGRPHYHRIQGRRLLVELDNTQNGANHVHTVVRDLAADFGHDVLGDHLRHAHGGHVR
jgi:hypothetical protein